MTTRAIGQLTSYCTGCGRSARRFDGCAAEVSPKPLARTIGICGEVLVTLGVIFALFVVYQVWWTNVSASAAANQARSQAQSLFAGSDPAAWPNGVPSWRTIRADVHPRLKAKVWGTPVVQGVDRPQLASGIGHYPQSAMPDQVGNFAVAGHRATNGEPFADFDQLRNGDKVIVRTAQLLGRLRIEAGQDCGAK